MPSRTLSTSDSMSVSSPGTNTSSDPFDLNSLRHPGEIASAFAQLSAKEEEVEQELEQLLGTQLSLEQQLRALAAARPQMETVGKDAKKLAEVIHFTAKLAEGVSVKVKQLDLAKSRVSDCQQRVNDLIDLKLCSDGVKTALVDEDYEQAAAHLHRFLAMDEALLKLTASEMQEDPADSAPNNGGSGTSSSLDAALKTLHEAETTVREVVARRFDEAVQADDLASIERFFKIFPLVNMHEEGLERFAKYLCAKLEAAAASNLKQAGETPASDARASVIFADTLTLLFEGVARTVEIHQPLIETYYGPGRLLTVISKLQKECDQQTVKVLTEFRKKRGVKDKTTRVREAMYGGSGSTQSADRKVTAKNLDHVLSEMTLLEARAEMYYKFVRKRVIADVETATDDEEVRSKTRTDLESLLSQSGLCHAMQDLLAEYILLEDFFMSQNVAMALSQQPEDDTGDMSSGVQLPSAMLDDVFFLLRKCVSRAVGGHNVDGVCAIVNNACGILEQDYCGLLQTQLRLGFPTGYLDLTQAYNVLQTSFQQGKLQGGDQEKQKLNFLTALNNADSSGDYIQRLTSSLERDISTLLQYRSQHDKEKIDSCMSGLPAVATKLKSILEQGMQQLRQSAVKPRIKPWMDAFVSHDIEDEQFSDYEANDPFVQTLIRNLDGLLSGFKRSLSENNYDALVSILTSEVTMQLEKAVLKSKFSRLGGLLFDREVRSLVSFLTSVTTWSVRDKFSRLTQMATVLNLESVSEMADIWGSGGGSLSWKLTPVEVRQVLGLRVDFPADEIKRLRL